MPTNAGEIEIFILTYNRAEMLRHAIESCIRQSLKGVSITVLDSGSTDHTAEVIASFDYEKLKFYPSSENIGAYANIKRCQKICTKKFVMIFHDDDLLHPNYLEEAFHLLKQNPDANIAVSNSTNKSFGSPENCTIKINSLALKLSKLDFANILYVRNKIAFSSAIYRKERLLSIDFDSMRINYERWADRPILIEVTGEGTAILLTQPYVQSGRHKGQDSKNRDTLPKAIVWLNREKFFKNILGDNLTDLSGLSFCIMNYRRIKSGFKRRINQEVSFSEYIDNAIAVGALTKKTWLLGWFAIGPIKWLINTYSKFVFKRRFRI